MNELHKRLEEAAHEFSDRCPDAASLKIGFIKGAELGYKEAIAQAKEWLKTHTPIIYTEEGDYTNSPGFRMIPLSGFLADFEADMNKLWEGEK